MKARPMSQAYEPVGLQGHLADLQAFFAEDPFQNVVQGKADDGGRHHGDKDEKRKIERVLLTLAEIPDKHPDVPVERRKDRQDRPEVQEDDVIEVDVMDRHKELRYGQMPGAGDRNEFRQPLDEAHKYGVECRHYLKSTPAPWAGANKYWLSA